MRLKCPYCDFEGELIEGKKCARCGESIVVFRREASEESESLSQPPEELTAGADLEEETPVDETSALQDDPVDGEAEWPDDAEALEEAEEVETAELAADAVEADEVEEVEALEAVKETVKESALEIEEAFEKEERAAEAPEPSDAFEEAPPTGTGESADQEVGIEMKEKAHEAPEAPSDPAGFEDLTSKLHDAPIPLALNVETEDEKDSEPVQEDLPLFEEPRHNFNLPVGDLEDVNVIQKRLYAGFIDIGLVFALCVFSLFFISIFGRLDLKSYIILPHYPFVIIAFFIITGYFVFFSGFSGQTPGKMLMRLQVTDQEGNLISFSRAFIRYVGYYFSSIPVFYGFISAFSDPERKAWHDYLARTRVEFIGDEE